jgi:hypothetical protein
VPAWSVIAGSVLAVAILSADGPAGAGKLSPEQQAAVAAIEKLGGKITYAKDGSAAGIDLRDQKVRSEQLEPIARFPQLKTLVLWGPRITNAAMTHVAGLTELTDLELDNCSTVSDAGLAQLKGLVNLRSINLRRSSLTDEGLTSLAALPKLEQLHLLFTNVSDDGLLKLKDMRQVTLLDVRGCAYITDKGLGNLSDLTNLKTLKLQSSEITDAGLEKLKPLKNLRVLAIEDSQRVKDDGMASLSGMSSLEDITLMRDGVGDAGLAHFGKMKGLKRSERPGGTARAGPQRDAD